MVLVPPQARPSGGTMLGNHEARIRVLERRRISGGEPRHVYGRMYNDGGTLWAGSGDWTAAQTTWITVTIDPPFTEGYEVQITPNDNGDTIASPPDLQPATSVPNSYSGFLQAIQVDLGTFRIMFWDLDGNKNANRCGFDFEAVGT